MSTANSLMKASTTGQCGEKKTHARSPRRLSRQSSNHSWFSVPDLRISNTQIVPSIVFHVTPAETGGRSFVRPRERAMGHSPAAGSCWKTFSRWDARFDDFRSGSRVRRHRPLESMVLAPPGFFRRRRQPGQVLLAIEDATERPRAAEALALSEIRYRRLFETARDGILIVDAENGRVLDANPCLAELLGYNHSELVGEGTVGGRPVPQRRGGQVRVPDAVEKGSFDTTTCRSRPGTGGDRVEFVGNIYNVGDAA